MALLRFLYYFGGAIAVLILLGLVVAFVVPIVNHTTHQPRPVEVTSQPGPLEVLNQPAGLEYSGPQTTAVAGWYCIVALNSTVLPGSMGLQVPVGYSIQLSALLSNGAWVQNTMGPVQCVRSCISKYVWAYISVFWVGNSTAGKGEALLGPATCGWLVISIVNGTAYVGYSTDGKSVTWYGEYPVGGASIVPNPSTQLVLAGPCCS